MIVLSTNGNRDLAVERVHCARALADVLACDLPRKQLTEAQLTEVRGRIERHRAATDELERAVAEFDAAAEAP